jgi:23S rRNA (uracil1939-C5)-methyltransferase
MKTKTVLIEKIVHGGFGLSRTDEGVIFVEGTMPGETVEAVIDAGSRTGGALLATCATVVKPSPHRRLPVCPLYGTCGGCDWQHMAYDAQLSIKEGIFRESLVRIGRIADIPSITVIASPEQGYRRRVQFKIDPANKKAGFFRKKSNEVVELSYCPLLCEPLNGLLGALPSLFGRLAPGTHEFKAIAGDPSCCTAEKTQVPVLASAPVIPGVTGPRTMIRCGLYVFPVSGGGFFQGNRFLAPQLGQLAAEWCGGKMFLDLYGGSGFFSVYAASKFTKGILVETEEDHLTMARETFRRNGITSVTAEKSTARDFLQRMVSHKSKIDCCIVDPPRTGLERGVAQDLSRIGPPSILSVSCDPATQARDAGFLINKCGYHCEKAALFDLYPQTHHLETVLLLSRPA